MLLAATLLPLLIYALVSTGLGYRDDRRAVESATLARAVRISDAVDARLEAVAATMRALSTIRAIRQRDWQGATERAAEIAGLDPDWRGVELIDLRSGATLVHLRAKSRQDRAGVARTALPSGGNGREPAFSGAITGSGEDAELFATMVVGRGTDAKLLRIGLDPMLVQRILARLAPREGVSAVVDTSGLFIGRTQAWKTRIGKPATRYVRQAIVGGRSGIYRGVTYEGFENYTAFATSARSGWSAHVAVSSGLIDQPMYGWRVAAVLAGLTGLALALAMVLLIFRLVAARRAADERSRQTERLEAVGKLTGGIAHDFNNMLAIVIGSLDIAQRRLAGGNTDIGRHIDNATEGARRAADLTRRLLAFSRRQPLAPAPTDANALIRSTSELLRRTLAADIAIELELNPELWPTFVDAGQLENAVVNLAVNARDAMPDGGRLTISTDNRKKDDSSGGEFIAVVVRDTGIGMSTEVAARAFEPFYTTKDVGRGTGLGLSQIHGFATQSGGDATIESRSGVGTSVTILLPRYLGSEEVVARLSADSARSVPMGLASEILLVVEDEEQVRRTNVEALRSLGYTVRHAADAREALAVLETQPGIRLMLTDIVMPGMSGRDLAERVTTTHPSVRILLATGYEPDRVESDDRVLLKPFDVGELARRVRSELDSIA